MKLEDIKNSLCYKCKYALEIDINGNVFCNILIDPDIKWKGDSTEYLTKRLGTTKVLARILCEYYKPRESQQSKQ